MIVVLGITVSMAQNRDGQRNFDPEESAKRQTEEFKKVLDLKKDQEKKVYDLNLKTANKMVKIRKDMQGGGDRDAMRAKFGEIMDCKAPKAQRQRPSAESPALKAPPISAWLKPGVS